MSANTAEVQLDIDHEASNGVSTPTERHPEFYFDDSLVVIQVENTLFKVHKYQLTKSNTFSDMFEMPKEPTEGPAEGASPEHPIVLKGVKSSDFEALLKMLYAVHYTNKRPKCGPEIIVSAFRLAHMWNFSDLRDHLFPLATDALGCVDKIILGRELEIREWLVPAHMELCQRTKSLTMAEATKLGMQSTVMIFQLRGQSHPPEPVPTPECVWTYCHSCGMGPSVYAHHGNGDCRKCGRHLTSLEPHYHFPASPSNIALLNAVPVSGNVWTYCYGCAGHHPVWGNHGAAANCHRCGAAISASTLYFRFTTPSAAPPSNNVEIESQPSSNVEIESQLKKWVEGGCVTE